MTTSGAPAHSPESAGEKARRIHAAIPAGGLFFEKEWRISPEPMRIDAGLQAEFLALGGRLLRFYRALNDLYYASAEGAAPAWVAQLLDAGKPEWLVAAMRKPPLRDALPKVIRPDILLTEEGWKMTELDSVPGGLGLTGWLEAAYGEPELIPELFHRTFLDDARAAVVLSEEASAYRPEMQWLLEAARELGGHASGALLRPEELEVANGQIRLEGAKLDRLYRFFELFDWANVPHYREILAAAAEGRLELTPPPKTFLEEKLAFALFCHPELEKFWKDRLGDDQALLSRHLPQTWIVGQTGGLPLPNGASSWDDVRSFSQKKRRLVLKISGFSERAWGSRGVRVGHDMPQDAWAEALREATDALPHSPWVLQPFEKARRVEIEYFDFKSEEIRPMPGRARLCPFYLCPEGRAEWAGTLATICPLDKKLIHGMRDAVMTLAVARSD